MKYFALKLLINPLSELGNIVILIVRVVKGTFTTHRLTTKVIDQCYQLGIRSIVSTVVTAIFIGLVFSWQMVTEFEKFGANLMIGGIVGLAIWRELGPLLTAIVASGRVGAAISSEIGTMKVTEQIDALEALSHDPVKYLVIPRVLAASIMLPLLVGIADIIGFLSGLLVAKVLVNMNHFAYFNSAQLMLGPFDIVGGLIKAVVFGFVISLISCYRGLNSGAGAKGVGETTTRAVVQSLMTVFVLNYFLTILLF